MKKRYLKKWVEDLLIGITIVITIAICSFAETMPMTTFFAFSTIGIVIGIFNAFIIYKYGREEE